MGFLAEQLATNIQGGTYDNIFKSLYIDENCIEHQKKRYLDAISNFTSIYGNHEISIFSAPGRSEIGGNHTDHQCGKVLATSVNIDTIAVVTATNDNVVKIKSEGYPSLCVDISDLHSKDSEKGTTEALVRGVAFGMKSSGYRVGGFCAYITSQVLSGSGLSSSAAYEVLIGNIFSDLFNEARVDSVAIAKIGQMAENDFFGKPSGLMDQMACSVGGLIHIDFKNTDEPVVEKIDVDFEHFSHSLCIIDTKGSHADLTDDYAKIPEEMKRISSYFNVNVLREIDEKKFYQNFSSLRNYAGDRAVLRAIHYFDENHRVDVEKDALIAGKFDEFKQCVWESGDSSFKYLQNVYTTHNTETENLVIGLAIANKLLGKKGVCRVHGGGFAGTIQAIVPDSLVSNFKSEIEKIFGEGSCYVLKVRPYGGIKVI